MASRSWNRVELIGNLTRDPELRYTPNGAAVCTFGLATNRTYVTEGERKEEVDFHRLVSWNKLAELCNQLLKKGVKVFISGRLQTRSWEAQDGTQRTVTEIVVEDMILLTPKSTGDYIQSEDIPPPEVLPHEAVKDTQAAEASAVKAEPETPEEGKKQGEAEPKEKEEKAKPAPAEEVVDSDLPF